MVLQKETHLMGLQMTTKGMDAEELLQLYAFLAAIADPVRKLSSVYTRIQSGAAASDRIFSYLDRQPRVQPNSSGRRLIRHHSSIEFRDVCFSYDPGMPILTNVHLKVRFGETVALVGLLRVKANVRVPRITELPIAFTVIVAVVTPGLKVSVPLAAW